MKFIFGVFVMLHGLIHLLYSGQSARYFELKPGMVWPDGSWAFSRFLGNGTARNLASLSLTLAALGLIAGGIGILTGQAWWLQMVVIATTFSSIVFIIFWDGRMHNLDGQGVVGILINVAILVAVLIFRWTPY